MTAATAERDNQFDILPFNSPFCAKCDKYVQTRIMAIKAVLYRDINGQPLDMGLLCLDCASQDGNKPRRWTGTTPQADRDSLRNGALSKALREASDAAFQAEQARHRADLAMALTVSVGMMTYRDAKDDNDPETTLAITQEQAQDAAKTAQEALAAANAAELEARRLLEFITAVAALTEQNQPATA